MKLASLILAAIALGALLAGCSGGSVSDGDVKKWEDQGKPASEKGTAPTPNTETPSQDR